MSELSSNSRADAKARMLGLGKCNFHKSYYPELRRRLAELQQTQVALQDSEQRFQQMAQSIDQVFWLIDLATKEPIYVSPAFAKIWGREFDYLIDDPTNWLQTIVEEDRPLALKHIYSNCTGEPFNIEYRIRRPDGTVRWIRDHGFPVRNANGEVYRMTGIAEDVTYLKESEQRLEQAKEAAENASAAKDRFLAALSHELRTPLTPVLLVASTLQEDPSLPAETRDQISVMRRHVEMEARLIDDLLDLTRISAGRLDLQRNLVDLHRIIESVLGICHHDIQRKRLDLQLSLTAQCTTVLGDTARLQQVFWNLLKNAVKFTPEGGKVYVRSRNRNTSDGVSDCDVITLEVQDTGIGMDADTMGRIFNVFQQGSRRITREFGGLGMGLSISKAIVDLHHGTITAASAGENQGACFTVELNCWRQSAAEPVGRTADNLPSPAVGALRILLVEDHEATGHILRKLLQHEGHKVTLATSVASGRACLEAEPFDLLISDIGLPDGSGASLGPVARSKGLIRLIALSGFGMDQDIQHSLASGFSRHLTKPVDFPRLKAAITELAGD